jgi:PKD repeat protein
VTTWTWDFDGAGTAPNGTTASASFTFAAQGTYPVMLTVGDAEGLTHSVTRDVVVAAPPVNNVLPTASFVLPTDCVAGTPCGFQSTSTDQDGTIASVDTDWTFGDGGTGEGTNATHTYATAGTFTVTLTVIDNLGGTASATQQLVVTAPASQDCTTTGTFVSCSLTVTQRATIRITMVSEACQLSGNKLEVTAPRAQTAFFNLCNRVPGDEYIVTDAGGAPLVFEAGTVLTLRFTQGTAGPTDPPTGDPGIQVDGTYPTWTLNIDDGGAAGTDGEPDFDDAVLSVQATLAP